MKKKILLIAGIVLAFLVLSYGFVPEVLGGKIVNQSDISGWQGMSHEMMTWNAEHPGNQTAWTESMFGGMPTTTIHASTKGDWTQAVYDLLLTGRRPATYLFISLLGAFLLMLSLGIHPLIAAGGAIAVTFCSYNFQIIQVGHNTKMQALAFLPWVLAALIFTYRSALRRKENASGWRSWLPMTALGAALFGLALSFQVKANHPQITWYLALMIFIYAVVMLVWMLRDKERRTSMGRFWIASALLLVLGICGIGTNAIKLLPTMEYTPYSMRGGSTASEDGTKASKGLDLDYATAWSYGWEELPNLLIPNYNGGSSSGAVNPKKSVTYDLLKRAQVPNLKDTARHLPLYWGPQPFTAGPMYMGAITIFLFIFGLCWYRDRRYKWWLVAATVIAVLLSLGNHFLMFTKLFYDCAPLYNKFRTVSMALVILQFTLPMLGFMMLNEIVKSTDDSKALRKKARIAFAITAGLCLVLYALQSWFGSFEAASDASMQEELSMALGADRMQMLTADFFRSLLLIVGAYAILFWGVSVPKSAKETFATQPEMVRRRRMTAAVLVCVLVLFDMFTVGKRYLNSEHFVTPRQFTSQFNKRPVDEAILQDTDPSYRVLDLTVDPFNDSHPSYWHKNIGGYSPAKLQRYQEFIDSNLRGEINGIYKQLSSGEFATVGEMEEGLAYYPGLAAMNCRYLIVGAELAPIRYRFARGNAWFEGEGDAELLHYAPNELSYSCSSERGGTLVFSEVYYPEGWTLVMDGKEELPIRLYDGSEDVPGGILRCADVPAGEHSLVMSFRPASYSTGEAVSRACSILLILIVLAAAATVCLPKFKKSAE